MSLELLQWQCRRLGPQDALIGAALDAQLAHLRPDWSVVDQALQADFRFSNFQRTMAFVNAVAAIAHEQDHHPDMRVGYGHCQLRFATHSAGGITLNDLACAARVNALR